MADKMQPGRFTIRFNMNDPQQRAAVEILNRMGRQKAQFIAQALTHYAECKCHPQMENQTTWDERALERAILELTEKFESLEFGIDVYYSRPLIENLMQADFLLNETEGVGDTRDCAYMILSFRDNPEPAILYWN